MMIGGGALVAARVLLARQRRLHSGLIQAAGRPSGDMPDDGIEARAGLSSAITPVDQFYVTDVNMGAPLVDLWRYGCRRRRGLGTAARARRR